MSDATARAARKHRLRCGAFAALLVATLTGSQALAAPASDVHDVVTFQHAPFPYDDGFVPEQNVPFFQRDTDGRLFHQSPRGGKLYRDPTYSSPDSLLFVPAAFDPSRKGAAIVLFFHGNLATLATVESQQRVSRQLAASHINAALVAPQMAVRALDSSAGHFYEPGFFDLYMNEAETHLAERSGGRFDRRRASPPAGRHRGLQRRLSADRVHAALRGGSRPRSDRRRDPARRDVRRNAEVRAVDPARA